MNSIEHYSKSPSKARKHARKLARLQKKKALLLACIFALYTSNMAYALPEGGNVVAGQANISQNGNTMTVNQSTNKAIINWNSFSIAQKEAFIHNMPSAQAAALHRVIGSGSSDLAGLLKSNANIYLVNPNGITIHQGAQIQTGGFVATTNDIKDADFMAGRYIFDQAGKEGAQVINRGNITVADAGFAVLVAPSVRNEGIIAGKLAKVVLASGESFVLDLHGDELIQFKVDENAVDALYTVNGEQVGVENSGTIKAEGGIVVMTAAQLDHIVTNSVNNTGVVMADSATSKGGKIIFGASGDISNTGTVTASSTVSDGGTISMIATNEANIGGTIEASGKNAGGSIDITADEKVSVQNATIEAKGASDGLIRIGGEFQGGQDLGGVNAEQKEGYVGRFDTAPTLASTKELIVDENSTIDAGEDGTVIAWSDGTTKVNGTWAAKYLETSGKYLGVDEDIDVKAGELWLLDPANVTISTAGNSSGAQADWTNFNAAWVQDQLRTIGGIHIQAENSIKVSASIDWNTNTTLSLNTTNSIPNQPATIIVDSAAINPNSLGSLIINSEQFQVTGTGNVIFNANSNINASQSFYLNNNASASFYDKGFMLNNLELHDNARLNIYQNLSTQYTAFDIFDGLSIDRNATLNFIAQNPSTLQFNIHNNPNVLINGSIIAGDDDTISFGPNPGDFIIQGRNSTKTGHAIQAGKVIIDAGSSTTELEPFSIYAKEVSLNGSVTGFNNTALTPGITIDGDRPQVEPTYNPGGVVFAYTSEMSNTDNNNNNNNNEQEKINNSVNALDKEHDDQNEYLRKLIASLTEDQLNVLRSLSPTQLEFFYSLSEASRLNFLSLSSGAREQLLSLEAYTQQMDDLLELPMSQLLAVLSLNQNQLQAFANMPVRDWTRILDMGLSGREFQRFFSLSEEQFDAIFTLSDLQIKDLLDLPDGYYSTALELSFAELQEVLSFSREVQDDLLALSFPTRTAFLELDSEMQGKILSFGLSTSEYHTLFDLPLATRDQILGTWFSTGHVKTILNLSEELREVVLNLPTDNIHQLADIWLMLELPADELPNALRLASMFSGTRMEEIMTLTPEEREKVLSLASEYPVNDLSKMLALEDAHREFVLEMQPSRTTIAALTALSSSEFDSFLDMNEEFAKAVLSFAYSTNELKNYLNLSPLAQDYIVIMSGELLPSYTRKIATMTNEEISTLMLLNLPVKSIRNFIDTPAAERAALLNVPLDLSAVKAVATSFNDVPANYDELNLTMDEKVKLLTSTLSGPAYAYFGNLMFEAIDSQNFSFLDLPISELEELITSRYSSTLAHEWKTEVTKNIINASGGYAEQEINIVIDDGVHYVPPVIETVRVNIPIEGEERNRSWVESIVMQLSLFDGDGNMYDFDYPGRDDVVRAGHVAALKNIFNLIIDTSNSALNVVNFIINKDLEIPNI